MMTKRSILDHPGNQKEAIGLLAVGVSQAKVARAFGIGRSSVSRWKSRAEIRGMIHAQAARLADAVPDAVDFQRNMVRAGKKESGRLLRKNPKPPDYKLIEAAGRSAENVLKATGLLPAATTSQTFNSLIVGGQDGLSPVIARLLAMAVPQIIPQGETPVFFVEPEGVSEEDDTR